MKKISVLVAATIVAVGVSTASCDSIKSAKLTNDVDSASYAIGVINGAGFRDQLKTLPGDPANIDALIAGFVTTLKGDSSKQKLTVENAQTLVQEYLMNAQQKESDKLLAEGQKFLEENKTKSGVFTTESGLQYIVVTEGTGEKPTANDRIKVHYTGSTLDGEVFDSSEGGEPRTFGINQVIPGWTEGLQIMPVGSKYTFWIPSELAYGSQGSGRYIKPNSVLKFDVELLGIEKGE
ncbi:peptidyl-prolyl cis-trans isomerase [Bacteroidia bacterium]|nr:peptidyl-prolyl cis-trans isomerase [Bacteroidia bacterium]GHU58000.1 peptidyl-prolyl cis-trans isomerase [Bacteroidia bacterium]GHV05048.1 peptidyl-prolyl cis-trans isomerase [Bacteroidia bacterium]